MNPIYTPLVGRLGNALFQYAHCRALAEQRGVALHTPPWIGEVMFDIPLAPREDDGCDLSPGYHQDQASIIYTREQARKWFAWKPSVLENLKTVPTHKYVAHYRSGDFLGYGFVVVSPNSFVDAFNEKFPNAGALVFVEDCGKSHYGDLPDYIVDFYVLTQAEVLFRANSSYSWWAAVLGNGRVFAPIIDGVEGGKIQHCQFVEGNWPKLSNLENITDLHLP